MKYYFSKSLMTEENNKRISLQPQKKNLYLLKYYCQLFIFQSQALHIKRIKLRKVSAFDIPSCLHYATLRKTFFFKQIWEV